MKRIALSLMTIAMVATMAAGATSANFSDSAVASNNTFAAGTLDLKVNDQDALTQAYTIQNIHPGSWDAVSQVVLKNTGSLTGHAWLEIVNVKNLENACNAPEIAAGDITCGAGDDQGELGNYAKPIFARNVSPWGYFGSTTTPINSEVGTRIDLEDLSSGETLPLFMYSAWAPSATDNLAQGDSVSFDIVFHLDQI